MERLLAEVFLRLLTRPVRVGLFLGWLLIVVARPAFLEGFPPGLWAGEFSVASLVWILGSGLLDADRKFGRLALFWVRPRRRWLYLGTCGLALWLAAISALGLAAFLEVGVRSAWLGQPLAGAELLGLLLHSSLIALPMSGVVLPLSALLSRGADFAVWFLGLQLLSLANGWSARQGQVILGTLAFELRRWLLPWAERWELWRAELASLAIGIHLVAVTLAMFWLACSIVARQEAAPRPE